MIRAELLEKQSEILLHPVSSFESAGDCERRLLAENSGDYAFAVLLFLTDLRTAEVSIAEMITTQMCVQLSLKKVRFDSCADNFRACPSKPRPQSYLGFPVGLSCG